jgi:hypothetical protein
MHDDASDNTPKQGPGRQTYEPPRIVEELEFETTAVACACYNTGPCSYQHPPTSSQVSGSVG